MLQRFASLVGAGALALVTLGIAGCGPRALTEENVTEFMNRADDAARKRFAPEICELRGANFKLTMTFLAADSETPETSEISRKLYCAQAGQFAKLRQYVLERESLAIEIAPDGQTATVETSYVEKLPYYPEDSFPATPDDYNEVQILESESTSTLAIENGGIVFWETVADIEQSLVPKHQMKLPYD
jgi:hypothetical protein